MIKKLGLRKIFLQKLLHIKQLVLGIGLVVPETIVNILVLKIHINSRRVQNIVHNTIAIQEEIINNLD